jgi:PhnB protein
MGSDVGVEWSPAYRQGNNFSISINTDDKAEADRLFKALAQGGEITMPIADVFWGDYFGMLVDKFGVNWMISYNPNSFGNT